MKGNFYKDAMEYYREKNSPMAAELYIPCGMFRPKNDHDFVESPMVLMSGAVLSVGEAKGGAIRYSGSNCALIVMFSVYLLLTISESSAFMRTIF